MQCNSIFRFITTNAIYLRQIKDVHKLFGGIKIEIMLFKVRKVDLKHGQLASLLSPFI